MAQRIQSARRPRAPLLLLPLVAMLALSSPLLLSATRAFVSAPGTVAPRAAGVGAVGAAAGAGSAIVALLAPLAAHAELPPLEDLPLDEIAPTRQFGPADDVNRDTFLGISFPMAFVGIGFAACWAGFWVFNLKPKKDEEGTYRTYIGAGELPPDGFTNPLDPRMSEIYDQEDLLDSGEKKEKKDVKASSAIV